MLSSVFGVSAGREDYNDIISISSIGFPRFLSQLPSLRRSKSLMLLKLNII